MRNLFILSVVAIFMCTACKAVDDKAASLEPEITNTEDVIEGGYPYDSDGKDTIIHYADKIANTVYNPFVGAEERIKLAIELDGFQHPNLPPAIFPEVSSEIAHKALAEVKRLSDLSLEHYQLDEMEEAINLSKKVIEEYETIIGPNSENLLVSLYNLGFFYAENKQFIKAEAAYQRGVNIVKMRHGDGYKESHHYANASVPLVDLYVEQFEYAKAKPIAEQILTTFEKYLGPDHYENGPILVNLGAIYHGESNLQKAEDSLLRAISIYENLRSKDDMIHELHVEALEALSTFYEVDFYTKTQNSDADYEYIWEKVHEANEQAKNIAIVFLGEDHPYTKKLKKGLSIYSIP